MKQKSSSTRAIIKLVAIAGLTFNLGVTGIYAQTGPLDMAVSGTAAASTINLRPGTTASEYHLAGNSRLGQFDFRTVSVSIPAQQPQSCSGANKLFGSVVAGGGVFRFNDSGDLLTANLTGGSDCIDLAAGHALCIRVYKITGGTGRLENAAGATLTLTMITTPVVGDSGNNPVFFAITGTFTGAIPGVAVQGRDDRQQ
jgi:hypothetical protein